MIIPIVSLILFLFSKYPEISEEKCLEKQSNKSILKNKMFYILLILMFSAGATELGVATWSSTYAEIGLGVSKPYGDLYGPALFALVMGLTRFIINAGRPLPLNEV